MHTNIKCCVNDEVREIHTVDDCCKESDVVQASIKINFINKCRASGDDINSINFQELEYEGDEDKDEPEQDKDEPEED